MLCEHCGKEIPGNSKFCRYCGQPVVPQTDEPAIEPPEVRQSSDEENPQKKKHLLLLVAIAVAICGLFFFYVSKAAPSSLSVATSSGSEYKNRLVELRPRIVYHSEAMVKEAFNNPTDIKFTHNWESLSNDGIFLTNCGTLTYNDSSNKEKTQNFEATIALDEQDYAYHLMLKLDDKILYNNLNKLDNEGTIILQGATFNDKGYGERIFDNPINPDKWAKNAADFNNAEDEITLAEFTAINLGVSYKEACATIGSYGVENSRANVLGYETVIYTWKGIGKKDANATLTFTDDVLIAKEQTGLK